MERFGEFTVLEALGGSETADRCVAQHDHLGGPFFVKRYARLPEQAYGRLHERCERLMGVDLPHLTPHLGHGEADGIPFTVAPLLEGIALQALLASYRHRRAVLGSEVLVFLVQEMARAALALGRLADQDGGGPFAHGALTTRHIRVDFDGQVWLTGLPSTRIYVPDRAPSPHWDTVGAAAAAYEMWPLTRQGRAGAPLSPALAVVLRDFLGIDPAVPVPAPQALIDRLDEMVAASRIVPLTREGFAEVVQRARDALSRERGADAGPRLPDGAGAADRSPAAPVSPGPSSPSPAGAPSVGAPREVSLVSPAGPALASPGAQRKAPPPAERALEVLQAAGVLRAEERLPARIQAERRAESALVYLLRTGRVDDEEAARVLATASGLPLCGQEDLLAALPEPRLCRLLPRNFARQHRILPLRAEGGVLRVAAIDPFDVPWREQVQAQLGVADIRVVVVAFGDLSRATAAAYEPSRVSPRAPLPGPAVLLCTTQDAFAQSFGAHFGQAGFHVEHAEDLEHGSARLRAAPPDALVYMADAISARAERWLAELAGAGNPGLPIYVISHPEDAEAAARVLELGVEDYLTQPVNLAVLAARMRRRIGESATRPTPSPEAVPSSSAGPSSPAGPSSSAAPETPFAAMPTGVMGSLRQMPLNEIVQTLENGKKTAVVEVRGSADQQGVLAFAGGQVVYATLDAHQAEAAFYRLMALAEGVFRIRYGAPPPGRNIEAPTLFLLLEAMRRLDEASPDPDVGT